MSYAHRFPVARRPESLPVLRLEVEVRGRTAEVVKLMAQRMGIPANEAAEVMLLEQARQMRVREEQTAAGKGVVCES